MNIKYKNVINALVCIW